MSNERRTQPPPQRDHPSTGPTLGPVDDSRLAGLRRMRAVASGLLVLAAMVFVLTHGRDGVWGYVNAASEAAMVGAIADWFAVTALFRHPLRLPIPHTALIPRKKAQLGEGLEDFVTENFLRPEIVQERVRQAEVPLRVGGWLRDPEHAAYVVREAAPTLAHAVGTIKDEEVRRLLADYLLPRLSQEPVSPVIGGLLEGVLKDGSHHGLVDIGVRELHTWAGSNRAVIASLIGARAPEWSPKWLDDAVVQRIYVEIMNWLTEVRDQPDHPVRRAFDDLLAQFAQDLQHDPVMMQRTEALKERLLAHPDVHDGLLAVWKSTQHTVIESLGDPEGPMRTRLAALLVDLGDRLVRDDELRGALDQRVVDAAGYVVKTHGREISTLISQTVARWDGEEASRRIELMVGRDLQFIRINGTVVGGLVGLIIHAVAQLL